MRTACEGAHAHGIASMKTTSIVTGLGRAPAWHANSPAEAPARSPRQT